MGLYDRDYAYREGQGGGLFGRPGSSRRGGGPGSLAAWSANAWIIGANIAVHVIRMLFFTGPGGPLAGDPLYRYGYFSTHEVSWGGGLEFWRFVSFQFLHGNLVHLVFNMLGLYMFGAMVEQHLGRKKYLAFYLTTGIFGALLFLLLNAFGLLAGKSNPIPFLLVTDPRSPLIGASAGVFGVIMAAAYIAPDMVVRLLFPPVSMRLKVLAYCYVGLAVLNLAYGGQNQGGDAAHVGGAIAGYFFIRNSHLLRDFFDVLGDSRPSTRKPAKGARASEPPPLRLVRPDADAPSEAEVDRILAKHKEFGRESLTPEEIETLRRATQARQGPGGR
ncbi:MAG: rhomboid family intramembrane serine protease [Phycisphaerae bacterium]